ncbi:retinitis pigmentosa 9 protein homolog [Ovis aries]|uniref:retinitis pigmentosa 9 protein homolog n=1 Tax=Ovis aries TaxID=9940 RepID=UPI00072F8CFB|nr:retinitis pigmentosa 9 protein homolog [Ovis aries]
MRNLLLSLSRKMRLSQKTVYQMSQAMNMPGNFWPTHQPKDFGCHSGKKSKSCSAHEDPMYDIIQENKRHKKDIRIQQSKQLLEDSASDDDGSSSSSSEQKRKKRKRRKKRKHKSSKSNESSDSE